MQKKEKRASSILLLMTHVKGFIPSIGCENFNDP